MVRISKKDRNKNFRRKRHYSIPEKTGPLKDQLPAGYKEHKNSLEGELAAQCFIPTVKGA